MTAGREGAEAGVGGHLAGGVEDGDLSVGVLGGVGGPPDERTGRAARLEAGEQRQAQAPPAAGLDRDDAHPRACARHRPADGEDARGDGDSEVAGRGIPRHDGEGHSSSAVLPSSRTPSTWRPSVAVTRSAAARSGNRSANG